MRWSMVLGRAAIVLTSVAATAVAQDPGPAVPCRNEPCGIIFDWGSGTSAASLPTDRRYGAPLEFETAFKQQMGEKGFTLSDRATGTNLNITLRLGMMSAICDFMPGTNTDRSCKTVKDVSVTFVSNDPKGKKLNSMRFPNRCGAGDQVMSTTQFGRYVAELMQFAFEGDEKHLPRPVGKC